MNSLVEKIFLVRQSELIQRAGDELNERAQTASVKGTLKSPEFAGVIYCIYSEKAYAIADALLNCYKEVQTAAGQDIIAAGQKEIEDEARIIGETLTEWVASEVSDKCKMYGISLPEGAAEFAKVFPARIMANAEILIKAEKRKKGSTFKLAAKIALGIAVLAGCVFGLIYFKAASLPMLIKNRLQGTAVPAVSNVIQQALPAVQTAAGLTPNSQPEEDNQTVRLAKTRFSQIIAEANDWIDTLKKNNEKYSKAVEDKYNAEARYFSPEHIQTHVDMTNKNIALINDYVEGDLNHSVEDVLQGFGITKMGSTPWLSKEFKDYNKTIQLFAQVKKKMKENNETLCRNLFTNGGLSSDKNYKPGVYTDKDFKALE